jgi:hypothetical protein
MAETKAGRKSILGAVSDWLKLLALIVLVAEAVILIAMQITPSDSPIYPWYPVFMLLFLVVIVVGVFVDRSGERKTVTLGSGDQTLTVNPRLEKIEGIQNLPSADQLHADTRLKFSVAKPPGKKDLKVEYLDLGTFMLRLGVIPEEKLQEALRGIALQSFGSMRVHSTNILIPFGQVHALQFEEDSSTRQIEKYLGRYSEFYEKETGKPMNDDALSNMRQRLMLGDAEIVRINYQNGFTIHIFEKKHTLDTYLPPNLPNIFSFFQTVINEPIDELVASADAILWSTSNYFKKILVDQEQKDFTIFRKYQLIDNDEFIYMIQLQWSPQTPDAVNTWENLKYMMENFKIAR